MASLVSLLLVMLISCPFAIVTAINFGENPDKQNVFLPHSDIDTNGKVLRSMIIHQPPYVSITRNSSGDIVEVQGIGKLLLEWLSHSLNFTYIILLPENMNSLEDNAAGKGQMSAILEGKADLILGPIVLTANRYKKLNFPHPFVVDQFGFLIPRPRAQVNIAAVWKPFQQHIWIAFFVSMLMTSFFLFGIRNGSSAVYLKKSTQKGMRTVQKGNISEDVGRAWQYVFGVIFSQSTLVQRETSGDTKLSIRILAGAWCVSCFVLVTAYSSVLISFVTSPYYKSLIDSIYDIPKDPNIQVTVDRGLFPDLLFTNAEDGIYKYLGDQLRKNPELRCTPSEKCLDKVRNGSYIYTMGSTNLKNSIGIDVKRTGKCYFSIAKEPYFSFNSGIALPKHADVELFNRGILKAHQGGFIDFWTGRYVMDASRCYSSFHDRNSNQIRLGLGGLSGAFVLIGFGYCLSFLVFVIEILKKLYCHQQ